MDQKEAPGSFARLPPELPASERHSHGAEVCISVGQATARFRAL
jgi:hypothetical protein